MSIHRSLKTADTMKRHRSVLSRLERVKILQDKGTLNPREASVLGLPKVKHLKIRVKKEKSAAAPAAGTAAPAAAGAASPTLLSRDVPRRGASPQAVAASSEASKPKK